MKYTDPSTRHLIEIIGVSREDPTKVTVTDTATGEVWIEESNNIPSGTMRMVMRKLHLHTHGLDGTGALQG